MKENQNYKFEENAGMLTYNEVAHGFHWKIPRPIIEISAFFVR